ncbi:PD-(D/E)XK nuclease family protein [Mobilicoccus caccae]|uniref:DNA 3'-5' helicase n=1 Tax=Mobilicoccus caccae TaxID=1859295 RepID=A0ABQ6ILT3_9MICO|nr:PD-(D/E)XK nuclease family protein [Mobilicoccus caccae]GMA38889.1 hypothetical protein GCM10025883_09340 [Mobilicoccus caccae]
MRDLLMRAVEHGLDPVGLAELADREGRPVWAAAAQVLAEYDEVTALSSPGGYDPAWILTAVGDLLEDDAEARADVHRQVKVVVVDDAQELTAPAARLLRLLRSGAGEVVLVGDPDAATQTFRGADPRLMMEEVATQTVLERTWRLPTKVATVVSRVTDRIGSSGAVAHRLGPDGHGREATVTTGAGSDRGTDADADTHTDTGAAGDTQSREARAAVRDEGGRAHQPTLFDLLDGDVVGGDLADRGAEGAGATDAPAAEGHPAAVAAAAPAGSVTSVVGDDEGADDGVGGDGREGTSLEQGGSLLREGRVETAVVATAAAEARYISARLRRAHLVEHVPYSRMAVIVRGAGRSATMRRVLAGDGIPIDVPGARVPLRDEPAVRPFLRLFDVALATAAPPAEAEEQPGGLDAETVLDLLASPLGTTDSLAVRRLLRALRRAERTRVGPDGDVAPRSTDDLLVAAVRGDEVLDHVEDGAPSAGLRRIRDVLAAGVHAARREGDAWASGVTAETVLWAMWQASGLAEPWRRAALAGSQRADRDLDAVVALTDAAGRYVDRLPKRGPDGFLEHVRGQDVAGDTLVARAPSDECVTLTTPAGAAGLDWDLVVVAGVQEGVWPDLRLRGSVLGSADLVDTVTGRGHSSVAARSAIRSDEARLFLVAVSRTRDTLLCTAVRNDEETPSPFLDLVDHADGPRPYAPLPPPMTLPDVVAGLRRRLAAGALVSGEDATPAEIDVEAARLLARLAEAGASGAHPDEWWGLHRISDDRPRRGETDRLTVSPSKVESFARCEVRWLLAGSGGQAGGGSIATSLGTLVHDIAATTDNGDYPALVAELDRRWSELDLPQGWLERRQHEKAMAMLDRLARQHTAALASGWEVVGTEIDVEVQVGRAVVRGRVDRLERDAEGRLRVVDLKTGSSSSKPKTEDLPQLPQLGAYQVAVEEGGFGGLGRDSAGAALMQIGEGGGKKGSTQHQPPLADAEDPDWARTLLTNTAEGMAGATYRARAGTWCRMCESRFSCPIQPEGETLR